MNILLFICSLILVLFLYIHIQHHYYSSNDLEIYDADTINMKKQDFDELLSYRQPVIFNHEFANFLCHNCSLRYLLQTYHNFDVNISGAPIRLSSAIELFQKTQVISEDNNELLNDSGISSRISMNDSFFRPSFLFSTSYDVIVASPNTHTNLKYEICYRTFIIPTEGNIRIKCCPPKNYIHLPNTDNISSVNCWNEQEINTICPKVKFLEINVNVGQILYFPPYWWYSICSVDTISSVAVVKYSTFMNNVANAHIFIHQFLQNQNTKKVLGLKKITTNDNKKNGKKMIKRDKKNILNK